MHQSVLHRDLRLKEPDNPRVHADLVAILVLLMASRHKPQPKQKTRPKKGEPIEIPVPRRKDVMGVLKRAALRRTSSSK